MNGALSAHLPFSTVTVKPVLFDQVRRDQHQTVVVSSRSPNTAAMAATLALSNSNSSTSSVANLLSQSASQQRHTLRQSSAPTSSSSSSSRARALTVPVTSKSVDYPPKSGGNTCDTNNSTGSSTSTPPSPLVHSIKSSFSSSSANSSTPNYILLNKLRIQQHTRKNVNPTGTASNGAANHGNSNNVTPIRTSPFPIHSSIKAQLQSQQQHHLLGSKSSSSGSTPHHHSSSSSHSSPSRSSTQTVTSHAPIVLSSRSSGPLSGGSGRSTQHHNPRQIVTRVSAQDWLSANHHHHQPQRKDVSVSRRTSKPIVPNLSSISSSSPYTSLHDRACLSSPSVGFTNTKSAHQVAANNTNTKAAAPSGKLTGTGRDVVTSKVGSSSYSSSSASSPHRAAGHQSVKQQPIGATNNTNSKAVKQSGADRKSKVVSSPPDSRVQHSQPTDQYNTTNVQSKPTQVATTNDEAESCGGGQLRLQTTECEQPNTTKAHSTVTNSAILSSESPTTTTEPHVKTWSERDDDDNDDDDDDDDDELNGQVSQATHTDTDTDDDDYDRPQAESSKADCDNGNECNTNDNTDRDDDDDNDLQLYRPIEVQLDQTSEMMTKMRVDGVSRRDSATASQVNMQQLDLSPPKEAQKSASSFKKPEPSNGNLLRFIERSSPELIFLLSESAKLNYQLSQFEQKLNYLEEVFCKQQASVDNDTLTNVTGTRSIRSDSSQTSSWRGVIHRTRKWIAGVRLKNVFLEKKPQQPEPTTVNSGSDTKSTTVDNSRSDSLSNGVESAHVIENNQTEQEISSEDELIMLLDRIAKFSSNIVSKVPNKARTTATTSKQANEHSTTAESTVINSSSSKSENINTFDSSALTEKLNSLSNSENGSGGTRSKYEWLQSLPSNIKDLMGQLFPTSDSKPSNTHLNNSTDDDDYNGPDHDNFSHIFELNPELVKTLVENVKTNARLGQLRREFDRLMCSHLKSLNHSSGGGQENKSHDQSPSSQSSSTIKQGAASSMQSFRDAMMMSNLNATKAGSNQSTRQTVQPSGGPKWTKATSQSQSSTTSQSVKFKESDSSSHHQSPNSHDSTKSACCCAAANMVSDGDSGGEFTATTVTNDFNGSSSATTDDELSSLLNQIALCSQKIIEQTNSTSTSTTSTSSGCCCSSTSIDAKCGGVCSIGQHYFATRSSLNHKEQSSHFDPTELNGRNCHQWHSNSEIQFKSSRKANQLHRHNSCHNCRPASVAKHHPTTAPNHSVKSQQPVHHHNNMTFDNLNKLDNKLYSKQTHPSHNVQHPIHSQQQQQPSTRWPMGNHSFDDDYLLHSSSLGPVYSQPTSEQCCPPRSNPLHGKVHTNFSSPKRITNDPLLTGALNHESHPFLNNMTGFMLSSSAIDLLSGGGNVNVVPPPYSSGHHYNNRPNQNMYNAAVEPQLQQQQHYPLGGANMPDYLANSSTSAFIFDPCVDVESFLNEVEKELDDNCFASAPPFMSRNNTQQQLVNQRHLSQMPFHQQQQQQPPAHQYIVPRTVSDHHMRTTTAYNNQHHTLAHGSSATGAPLVNNNSAVLNHNPNLMIHHQNHHHQQQQHQMYSSLNTMTNRQLLGYANYDTTEQQQHHGLAHNQHHQQAPSSLLAGDNWRLTQRNSVPDLKLHHHQLPTNLHPMAQQHQPNTNNVSASNNANYFPFPSTASMPMGSNPNMANANHNGNTTESQRYKRLIVPSASRDLLDKFRAQVSYRVNEETENQLREIDQWLHEHLAPATPPTTTTGNNNRPHQQTAEQLKNSMFDYDGRTLLANDSSNLIQFGDLVSQHGLDRTEQMM